MTFSRVRSAWVDDTVWLGSEIATFDDNLTKAIDGAAGGTYNPSSPINIGGAGLTGTISMASSTAARISVGSGATALSSGPALKVNTYTGGSEKAIDATGDVTINGNVSITSNVGRIGSLSTQGNITCVGDGLSTYNDISLTNMRLVFGNGGRIAMARTVITTGGTFDSTLGTSLWIVAPSGNISIIMGTGAAYDFIDIRNVSPSYYVDVNNLNTIGWQRIPPATGGGGGATASKIHYIQLSYAFGAWTVVGCDTT